MITTKRILAFLLTVLLAFSAFSVMISAVNTAEGGSDGAAKADDTRAVNYLDSGVLSLPKLTQAEISALLVENTLKNLPADSFDVQPSLTSPYAPGTVKSSVLERTLNRLNALRSIAGLKPVTLDATLTENSQYGALLLRTIGFSHYPEPKPADMDDSVYQRGRTATSSSNIASGNHVIAVPDQFMHDNSGTNIEHLGHRRWQLNPRMGKTGFGFIPNYTCEWSFDNSQSDPGDYNFIAWPASGNFPANTPSFQKNTGWSVTLNPSKYSTPVLSDLTVTLTCVDTGATWTFSGTESYTASSSGKYFGVNTVGYGVSNCIIFRPDGVDKYDGVYTVNIQGIKDKSGNAVDFNYKVVFFDADDFEFPTDGELIVDKQVRLEADGTYSFIYSAYATGTMHDRTARIREAFSRNFTNSSTNELTFSYKFYECLGIVNGEYAFKPISGTPSGANMTVGSGWSSVSGLTYNIGGFDFRANTCLPNGGGYKIEATVSGFKLRDTASGTFAASSSSYIGFTGEADVNFPECSITVGSRYVPYDFGLAYTYDGNIVSIDTTFAQYAKNGDSYAYNTYLSGDAYTEAITGGAVIFEPVGISAAGVESRALIRFADGGYEWSRLTFLPASLVLYEDDNASITYTNGVAPWTVEGSSAGNAPSAGGIFGYDASYADDTSASNGTAHAVTLTRDMVTAVSGGASWPTAEFAFKGTGFELVSRCGETSGFIAADIVPADKAYNYTGSGSRHIIMDTRVKLGYDLYQCPVLRITGFEYGEYKVRLRALYASYADVGAIPGLEKTQYELIKLDNTATRAAGALTVQIDGIRIYDPAGTEVEAYKAFNEYKPEFKNIRLLVDDGSALNLLLDDENHTVKSTKYDLVSPLHETYIAANGSVAFTVSGDCSAVHMSLKSPNGKPIIVKINGEQLKDETGNKITIDHTTELYYDITEYIGANGEISVTCELPSGENYDAILSLVNLKLIPNTTGGNILPAVSADSGLEIYVEAVNFGITGDANHDRTVDITDIAATLRAALGIAKLDAYGNYCADVDLSGGIDIVDAARILRLLLGINN